MDGLEIDDDPSVDDVAPVDSMVDCCDVGELLASGIDMSHLSRDHMYRVLKSETSTDPKSYSCTRAYPSDSARQFQPSWLKQYPWLLYNHNVDGAYTVVHVFFAPAIVGGNEPAQQKPRD